MPLIVLHNGPMDLKLVQPHHFQGRCAYFKICIMPKPPAVKLVSSGDVVKPIKYETRIAVYELIDDESAAARFVGYEQELASTSTALADAMANAPHAAILELLAKVSAARRPRRHRQ